MTSALGKAEAGKISFKMHTLNWILIVMIYHGKCGEHARNKKPKVKSWKDDTFKSLMIHSWFEP